MAVELLGGSSANSNPNPTANPQPQDSDPAAQLKAQLDKVSAENQQLRSQWQERSRQYDQTVGRLGQQLDSMQKKLGELSAMPAAPPRTQSYKIPNPVSENFETELEGHLTAREERLMKQIQDQGTRLNELGSMISKLGFGIAVKSEQDELRSKYGFSDAEIEEAMQLGSQRNYDSVYAAVGVIPHLRDKLSKPALPTNASNGNGNPRLQVGSENNTVNNLASEFSRQQTNNIVPTSASNKPSTSGYPEKMAQYQNLISTGRMWEIPDAERRDWMNWATGIAAGQIPMQ